MTSERNSNLRLPNFLIIGAMKAGTTSLSEDLRRHPSVRFPSVKEPHFLTDDAVLTASGRERYARLFAGAGNRQLCGEASTGYTKLPTIGGVPWRAKTLLGREVRLVYLVRDPIQRAISHHYHLCRACEVTASIDKAIREIPELVDYGLYAMQLKPWLETFGRESIYILRFEDYVFDRRHAVTKVCRFLGIKPGGDLIDAATIHNDGGTAVTPRPVFRGILSRMTRASWYKVHVHSRIPRRLRGALKPLLMRKPPPRPVPPSSDSVAYLTDRFRENAEQLRVLMKRDQPVWDWDAGGAAESRRPPATEVSELPCRSSAL
jgi:hypothetical protein